MLGHTPQDDSDFIKMQEVLAQQDRWKNIHLQDFLPEFAQLIR